jgi:spore coat protein H
MFALRRFGIVLSFFVSTGCGSAGEDRSRPDWGQASVLGGGGVLKYELTVDPADLGRLIATATEETYVPAQLTVSGEKVGGVGLRFKGSDGSLQPCFENGIQICSKASFQVKFDFIEPARRFESLTRLNFHSMIDDPSLLHERLNAKLFTDMGIFAPRVAHAEIIMNGEHKGLFAAVEEVDQAFTRDRFAPGGEGNLYKEVWPTEIDPQVYEAALQAGRAPHDHSGMVEFAQALRDARPEELSGVLSRFVELDYVMRYLAVDRAIGNYDGLTTFYCDDSGLECANKNLYWYQVEGQSRFWLIPWYLGDSLTLRTPYDPVPGWDRPQPDCGVRFEIEGAVLMPAGCDPVFRGLQAAGRAPYLAALDRLLQVWELGALYRQIDAWTGEIGEAVARDPVLPGMARWRAAVQALKGNLLALREKIERTRAEMMAVVPFGLAAPGATDFEATTPLAFLLTTSSDSNLRSGTFHQLNQTGPISGTTDVRLHFELRNDSDDSAGAFSQWASLQLPLAQPTALPALKRIRARLRTDSIRRVRIEIASSRYGDPEGGERYGWSILTSAQAQPYVLEVKELALPDGTRPPAVAVSNVLSSVTGLVVSPEVRGRNDAGLLGAGRSDTGFVQLDDISLEIE